MKCFVFFFPLGGYLGIVQGLLLTLSSGMTPDIAQGIIRVLGMEVGSSCAGQSPYPWIICLILKMNKLKKEVD